MTIKNSLEAFKEMRAILNAHHQTLIKKDCTEICGYPLEKIERDLLFSIIIRDKCVDMNWIKYFMIGWNKSIEDFTEQYNIHIENCGYLIDYLNEEEMTTIIECIKERSYGNTRNED